MPIGVVTEFDEGQGLGAITTDDGTGYRFHCAEIADGTRAVDVGATVRFELLARLGRYQAGSIEKTG